MRPERWAALVVLALAIGAGASRWAYQLGNRAGYSDGWSDAHCGTGQTCESGQD